MIVFLKITQLCVSNVSKTVIIRATFMRLSKFLEVVVTVEMKRSGILWGFVKNIAIRIWYKRCNKKSIRIYKKDS